MHKDISTSKVFYRPIEAAIRWAGLLRYLPMILATIAAIVLACAATYLTKLAGYAVPARWLQNPRMTRVAGAITVALLSALTVMNTFAAGTALVIDARLAALGVAALAPTAWRRAGLAAAGRRLGPPRRPHRR